MNALVIEPMRKPYAKEIDGELESMQNIVGGLIQAIYPFEDGTVALICNEEGKLLGLPLNRALRDENGDIYDIIAGTFLICSAPPDSENFAGLSEEQMQKYKSKFEHIEIYFGR